MIIPILAGYPASLEFPPSLSSGSLPLITLIHPGYAEIVSHKTPPPGWVGVRGYKMNRFSRQFMRLGLYYVGCSKHLEIMKGISVHSKQANLFASFKIMIMSFISMLPVSRSPFSAW